MGPRGWTLVTSVSSLLLVGTVAGCSSAISSTAAQHEGAASPAMGEDARPVTLDSSQLVEK